MDSDKHCWVIWIVFFQFSITIVDLAFTDDVNHRFGTSLPTELRLEADFKDGSINMTIKGEWYKPDGHQIYVNITNGAVTHMDKSISLKNGTGLVESTRLYLTFFAEITRPKEEYLYIADREIIPTIFRNTVIIGKITMEADVYSEGGIDMVEFYVDDELKFVDEEMPYEWLWDERTFGRHEIKVIAYDKEGNTTSDSQEVWIFNI